MSLTSELVTVGSPIRRYFDECLPANREVQKRWRASVGACVVPPRLERLRGEVGLAAGHLLAGLAVGSLGWGVGGKHPAASLNYAVAQELDQLLRLQDMDPNVAAQASWYAGLFDRIGRGFDSAADPLLQPFAAAGQLDEAFSAIPAGVVDDLRAIAEANTAISADLPSPRRVCPAPSGSGYVGGADGDLIAGTVVVEIKTVADVGLNREHLRQLVAYPLLDFDDEWATTDVALWSLRFAQLETWPLDDLLSTLAGRATTAAEQRQRLGSRLRLN